MSKNKYQNTFKSGGKVSIVEILQVKKYTTLFKRSWNKSYTSLLSRLRSDLRNYQCYAVIKMNYDELSDGIMGYLLLAFRLSFGCDEN